MWSCHWHNWRLCRSIHAVPKLLGEFACDELELHSMPFLYSIFFISNRHPYFLLTHAGVMEAFAGKFLLHWWVLMPHFAHFLWRNLYINQRTMSSVLLNTPTTTIECFYDRCVLVLIMRSPDCQRFRAETLSSCMLKLYWMILFHHFWMSRHLWCSPHATLSK